MVEKDLASIKTMTELARLAGRDKAQVSRWVRRDDWPFSRKGPWPRGELPQILRWVADVLDRSTVGQDQGDGEDSLAGLKKSKLEQQVRRLRIQADTEETKLRRMHAALVERAEIEPALMRLAGVMRSASENLARQFGNEAAGIVNEAVDEWVVGVAQLFAADEGGGGATDLPVGTGDEGAAAPVDAAVRGGGADPADGAA